MKIKYLLSVIAIVAFTKDSFAQYSQDALRFSTFQNGSTSRIKAIGNGGTAIGGDLSSVGGNPAGIGFFTHSEISVTPELDQSKVNSTFFGNQLSAKKTNGNLSDLAVVIYQQLNTPKGTDKTKGWLSLNYGAALSHTNNFYENIGYGGKNTTSSISDYYAGQANSQVAQYGDINPDGLDGWAYNHNLIDNYGTTAAPNYKSNVYTGVGQRGNIARTGGQSEFDLSLGANYSNKLYLGIGVGLVTVRYNSHSSFGEAGTASVVQGGTPTDLSFNSTYYQDQVTKGSGGNVKLGVIYKPIDIVRLGFTFTSPTYLSIDDSYAEGLQTSFTGGNSFANANGDPYQLTYTMRTPLKVAGGAAIFLGRYGFITGDIEYIDYSTTHISSNDSYSADYDNGQIKALYKSAVNLHGGAEINVNNTVYLRGGYGVQGNPMKANGSDIKTATGGVGLRFGTYYVDATYAHTTSNQNVFPYEIGDNSPYAGLSKTNNNLFLTLGYTF